MFLREALATALKLISVAGQELFTFLGFRWGFYVSKRIRRKVLEIASPGKTHVFSGKRD